MEWDLAIALHCPNVTEIVAHYQALKKKKKVFPGDSRISKPK